MTDWILSAPTHPSADRQLYCFPHSGGSAGEYVRWSRSFRRTAVHALSLPGRGVRLDEQPVDTMDGLVEAIVADVDFEPGSVFFGHSLGALVAFEVTRRLRRNGRPLPAMLVASAHAAPHLPRRLPALHRLSDDELIDRIQRHYEPFPPELLADTEYLRITTAIMRADLRIAETYRHLEQEPLPLPLLVLSGEEDHFSPEELEGWQRHTSVSCRRVVLEGGHFYFRTRVEELARLLEARMGETETGV